MKRILILTALILAVAASMETPLRVLHAAGSGHNVVLTWIASSSAATYPTGAYSVFRGSSAGGEGATAIASGVSALTYTDTNVVANSTYYYTVEFCVGSVCSGPSNEASATIPLLPSDLAAPSGLAGSAH